MQSYVVAQLIEIEPGKSLRSLIWERMHRIVNVPQWMPPMNIIGARLVDAKAQVTFHSIRFWLNAWTTTSRLKDTPEVVSCRFCSHPLGDDFRHYIVCGSLWSMIGDVLQVRVPCDSARASFEYIGASPLNAEITALATHFYHKAKHSRMPLQQTLKGAVRHLHLERYLTGRSPHGEGGEFAPRLSVVHE